MLKEIFDRIFINLPIVTLILYSTEIKITFASNYQNLSNTNHTYNLKQQSQSKNEINAFITPSGNIACALVGEEKPELRCEIKSQLSPMPAQPYPGYCEFDWGLGFLLSQSTKPKILCISDTIFFPNHSVLSYGSTWTNSGFKCTSEREGLTCINSNNHGFFLSREKWNAF